MLKISTFAKQVGDRYSSYANEFNQLFGNDYTDKIFIEQFLKSVKNKGTVLDIGCGTGKDLKLISDAGYKTIGIDTSKEMLKIAKIKSPNTKFYLREAANTGFENESFDGVMSLYTFDHMKQAYMNKALNEVKRILKLGAPFLLIQHHGNFEGQKTDLMAPNKKLFRNFKKKVWLSDWLTQNGFRIIFSKVRKFPDIGVEESASNQVIVIAKKI